MPTLSANINPQTVTHQVNINYQYESEDINAIMRARLHGLANTHVLAGALMNDNARGNRIHDILSAYLNNPANQHNQNQTLLIPIERAAHWLGLRIHIEANVITAIYFHNSLKNPITDNAFMQSITQELHHVNLINNTVQVMPAAHDMQQDDGNSCGAYLIENIYCSLVNTWPSNSSIEPSLTQSIREAHLQALQIHQPNYYHHFVTRQAHNAISVHRANNPTPRISCYAHNTLFSKTANKASDLHDELIDACEIPYASKTADTEAHDIERCQLPRATTPPDFAGTIRLSLQEATELQNIFLEIEEAPYNPYSIYD